MPVSVASLGEGLATVGAREGPGADVGAYMIHYIAQFGEMLGARQTLQHLIEAARLRVKILNLPVTLALPDTPHVDLNFFWLSRSACASELALIRHVINVMICSWGGSLISTLSWLLLRLLNCFSDFSHCNSYLIIRARFIDGIRGFSRDLRLICGSLNESWGRFFMLLLALDEGALVLDQSLHRLD